MPCSQPNGSLRRRCVTFAYPSSCSRMCRPAPAMTSQVVRAVHRRVIAPREALFSHGAAATCVCRHYSIGSSNVAAPLIHPTSMRYVPDRTNSSNVVNSDLLGMWRLDGGHLLISAASGLCLAFDSLSSTNGSTRAYQATGRTCRLHALPLSASLRLPRPRTMPPTLSSHLNYFALSMSSAAAVWRLGL